jgi:serine protease AprX
MAGKAFGSVLFASRRRARLASALTVTLTTALAGPLLSAPAARASTGTCVVNPASTTGDAAQLLAGTDPVNARGYSMMGAAQDMGAWAYYNHGYYGQGVDVAEIDTGGLPIAGLNNGNLIYGPDLSFDGQTKLAHYDTNGHGTMMASIIAGRDATGTPDPSSSSQFNGMAPEARVVSIKVADSQGAVDVSQVIQGVDWVVAHAHTNGLNIRVLNISYGTQAMDPWTQHALSYAVDQAVKHGIVVVASTGNSGAALSNHGNDWYTSGGNTGVEAPAYNNNVIAVGSYSTGGTPKLDRSGASTGSATVSDDVPDAYSSSSSNSYPRTPDVVAPGDHVIGLHDVGAFMDDELMRDCAYPNPALPAPTAPWATPIFGPNDRYARGSGTSEAAALTSGAVALMLSRSPSLTPSQVKTLLMAKATTVPNATVDQIGSGEVNLANVYAAAIPTTAKSFWASPGTTLDNARGGYVSGSIPFYSYVDGYTELLPGACTNDWQYGWEYTTAPQSVQQTAIADCVTTPLSDKYAVDVNTKNAKDVASLDVFGNTVNMTKMASDEGADKAWQTPTGKTYQVWSGDPTITLGTGFVSDPILGQVWAAGPAWPTHDWVSSTQPLPVDSTHVWQTASASWADSGTVDYIVQGWSWTRHSLTGEDWSSHSLRDNAWY